VFFITQHLTQVQVNEARYEADDNYAREINEKISFQGKYYLSGNTEKINNSEMKIGFATFATFSLIFFIYLVTTKRTSFFPLINALTCYIPFYPLPVITNIMLLLIVSLVMIVIFTGTYFWSINTLDFTEDFQKMKKAVIA
jgi:nitrogen fixation-related uncharacterized protein